MKRKPFRSEFKQVAVALPGFLLQHLSELLLLLYALAAVLWHDKMEIMLYKGELSMPAWVVAAHIIPYLFVAAMSLQALRKRHLLWQCLYYALPLLLVPFLFIPSLESFADTPEYFMSVCLLLPLWLLLRRFRTRNRPFLNHAVHTVWSMLMPLFLGLVAQLMLLLIQLTIGLIFPMVGTGWYDESASIIFVLIVPLIFLWLEEKEEEIKLAKFVEIMLNWVVSPALMLYTALLYLYAGYILFRWDLPQGSVSVMVLVFSLIALLTQALRPFAEKQPFRWYFGYFSWYALPLLLLFWVSCFRRFSDYGLTEPRYYLLLSGLLMTLYIVLFLFRNKRGYYWLAASAFLMLLAALCIPPLSAERCSIRSQEQRVRHTAASIGLLNPDGTLRLEAIPATDSLKKQHRIIFQSLKYLENKDSLLIAPFGIHSKTEYMNLLSERTRSYAGSYRTPEDLDADPENDSRYLSVDLNTDVRFIQIKIPDSLHTQLVYDTYQYSDLIHFRGGSIRTDSLLQRQLRKCGWKPGMYIDDDWMAKNRQAMLTYHDKDYMLVFSSFSLRQTADGNVVFAHANLHSVFVK